jgi:hypothetical protein
VKGKTCTRILLSEWEGAEEVDVIEGPATVLNSMESYILPFYDYLEKNYYGALEDYDMTEGFVAYLNDEILKDSYHKVKIVEKQTKNFLKEYKRYSI